MEGSTLVVMSIRVNVITFNVSVSQSRGPLVTFNPSWPF